MKTLGRIFFLLFIFSLLLCTSTDLLPQVSAASSMNTSESCVEFIKKLEGFSAQPYYDYKQHTVGYGTKCPTDKYLDYMVNGISKSEAEALLRETLAEIEKSIQQKLMDPYHLILNQHQFDALVSFSFNLGTSWMTYDSTLRDALLKGANDDELVYAFGLYCTAGGTYSSGLISRRLCEANMYLNGSYSHSPPEDLGYVFYEPNGGSLTYQVQGFICSNNLSPAADAVRRDDVFLGWFTDLTGGSQVYELNRNLSGKTLFARWQSSEDSETEDSVSVLIQVTGDVVNIRKGPGTNYGIAKKVYSQDLLIVSHVTDLLNRKWGKVQDGWICLDYTNYDDVVNGTGNRDDETEDSDDPQWDDSHTDADVPPDNQEIISGIVCVNDLLRIRSGPGTIYSTIGYLYDGQEVEILEQKEAGSMIWGRISRGWISMDYIATEVPSDNEEVYEPEEESEPDHTEYDDQIENAACEGSIKADALRIRSGPGTEYPIVGFYYENNRIYISEKVRVNSVYWGKTSEGWINLDYVTLNSEEQEHFTPEETGVMTVIADCLRVRKQIGTDSRIAQLLYYGDTVTILETKTVDDVVWGRVHNGWVCMDYVS